MIRLVSRNTVVGVMCMLSVSVDSRIGCVSFDLHVMVRPNLIAALPHLGLRAVGNHTSCLVESF